MSWTCLTESVGLFFFHTITSKLMSKNKRKITPKNSNTPNRIGPFSSPVFLTYKTEKVSNTTNKTVKEVKSKVMEWLDMILK